VRAHVTSVLAVVGVAMFAIVVFLLQDTDDPSAQGETNSPAVAASRAPSASASSSAMSPTTTTLPSTGSASPAQPSAAGRITTSSLLYFGRPFETIQIPGTYEGVDGATTLRLQLRRGNEWELFPLPVVTEPSGAFRAYVELSRGQHRLRLVDPDTGLTSEVLTLLLL
jgi:hypothetical protein